jgi:hypothetical protein
VRGLISGISRLSSFSKCLAGDVVHPAFCVIGKLSNNEVMNDSSFTSKPTYVIMALRVEICFRFCYMEGKF